jgi:hypothetical protein
VGRATSGEWNAVFAAVRQLKEAYREATSVSVGVAGMVPPPPPPPPPGGLDSSFSRLAANHTVYSMHQRNTGVTNAPLDEVAISTQQAAVAIDREGILPVGSLRPLSAAAQALVPLSQHGNDPTKVGQLGDALRKLDPALARLAASEGSAININSSESLSNAARCLSTALCAMDAGIAATLRAELRVDEASLSLERREQLLSVCEMEPTGDLSAGRSGARPSRCLSPPGDGTSPSGLDPESTTRCSQTLEIRYAGALRTYRYLQCATYRT